MATRPELHEAVAGQKSKASEYNDNFDLMMDFVDNSIDEAKDYVEGFMPAISASTSGKLLTNDGSDASWVNFINNKPFANIIDGLVVRRYSDSNDTIKVTAGSCYDDTNSIVLTLGNDVTVTNSGQLSGEGYFVYIIGNGSSTDIIIDRSGSAPTTPTGYSYKRLLCYFLTDSSNKIRKFQYPNSNSERVLIETVSSKSNYAETWCNLYSDNWCEQGGLTSTGYIGETSISISFTRRMK